MSRSAKVESENHYTNSRQPGDHKSRRKEIGEQVDWYVDQIIRDKQSGFKPSFFMKLVHYSLLVIQCQLI